MRSSWANLCISGIRSSRDALEDLGSALYLPFNVLTLATGQKSSYNAHMAVPMQVR